MDRVPRWRPGTFPRRSRKLQPRVSGLHGAGGPRRPPSPPACTPRARQGTGRGWGEAPTLAAPAPPDGPQTPPLAQTPNPRPAGRPAPVRPAPAPGCVPAPAPSRGLRAPAARPELPASRPVRRPPPPPLPLPSPSLPTYPPPLPARYPPSRSGSSAASGHRLRLRRRGTRRGAASSTFPGTCGAASGSPGLPPSSLPPPPPPSAHLSAASRAPA